MIRWGGDGGKSLGKPHALHIFKALLFLLSLSAFPTFRRERSIRGATNGSLVSQMSGTLPFTALPYPSCSNGSGGPMHDLLRRACYLVLCMPTALKDHTSLPPHSWWVSLTTQVKKWYLYELKHPASDVLILEYWKTDNWQMNKRKDRFIDVPTQGK